MYKRDDPPLDFSQGHLLTCKSDLGLPNVRALLRSLSVGDLAVTPPPHLRSSATDQALKQGSTRTSICETTGDVQVSPHPKQATLDFWFRSARIIAYGQRSWTEESCGS